MHRRLRQDQRAAAVGQQVAGQGAGGEDVQQCGANRAADLLVSVDQGRGDAGVRGTSAVGGGVQRTAEHHAQACPDQEQGGQDLARVAGAQAQLRGQEGQAAGPRSRPTGISGRGPTRRISTPLDVVEAATIAAIIGRKASPDLTGE